MKEGYKHTEVGVIPHEWEVVNLGSVGEFKNGINKGKEDFGFGTKFVNIENCYTDKIVDVDKLGSLNANSQEIQIYKLIDGDIVLVRSSVKPEGVGYPILFKNKTDEDILYCGFTIRFRLNNESKLLLNPDYLIYSLRSNLVRNQVLNYSTVSANTNINQESYAKVNISVPTIPEQQKIASILSSVDEHIDQTDGMIEDLKEMKKGLMQKLLTKGIGHTEFKHTEVGVIPKEWEVRKIGDIADLGRGRVISRKEIEKNPGEYHVYSSQTTDNGSMGCISTYDYDGEYVTWTTDGVNAGKAFHRKGKFNCTNVCGTIKLKVDNINYAFLARILDMYTEPYVVKSGNPKLMNNIMRIIQVPIPNSVEEQHKIASILSSVDERIEIYEQEREDLAELKKGLMQQLLTGKVRVKA